MIERLISLFAPHICLVCGSEGLIVCDACSHDSFSRLPDRCYKCKSLTVDSAVCLRCRQKVRHVWVVTEYENVAKKLIYDYKFARAKAAAVVIAEQLNMRLPYFDHSTIVTYVPTASSRVRLRGYDHAALIACSFSKRRGLRCASLLARTGQERQVGSGRVARYTQASRDYKVVSAKRAQGQTVLILDDVLTTGATIESCGALLKHAGAKQVIAAVFAQKIT